MAVPTIAQIRPRRGAANGNSLIEITGTGFKEPVAPSSAPTVRVTIGGRWARNVLVYAPEYLVCTTPKGNPFTAEVAATASAVTNVISAAGHTLREGDRFRIEGTAPSPLLAASATGAVPLYACEVVPGVSFKASYTRGGAAIDLTTAVSFKVRSDGYQTVKIENLDENGVPIAGETVTDTLGFQFMRPDFSKPGQVAWTVRQFTQDMKRLCANVAWSTHSDYDESTGDLLSVARLASLPAIILSDLRFPEDRKRPIPQRQTQPVGETRFRETRPPIVMDILCAVTCVSDNALEILSMLESVRAHFQKNTHLEVPRDCTGADLNDVIRYEQHAKIVDVQVQVQEDAPTIHHFALEVEIVRVVSETDPGAPDDTLLGLETDGHHEATTAFGFTADRAVVGVNAKS